MVKSGIPEHHSLALNSQIHDLLDSSQLPVAAAVPELCSALRNSHALLSGPTGSGKTTLTPLALLAQLSTRDGKILLLEPRRLAARASALRMSKLLGETVGNTVGYRTRFDTKVSPSTRIEVITEGILIRMLQNNPELEGVELIIFDEFHERNLLSDLGLALCLELCELREELRLLIMSATLAVEKLAQLLGGAPHIIAEGRSYPVDIEYLPFERSRHQNELPKITAQGIRHALHNTNGDILAFLPGVAEIKRCIHLLGELSDHLEILPLYGNLPHHQQECIFSTRSKRRVIVATPIAETSLTIEGITTVVDSGYYRRAVYNSATGLSQLTTMRISKASAAQRAGRAGRLSPGTCYRLWPKNSEGDMLAQTPPEIVDADLTTLVLELGLWGVHDPLQLSWLDPPRSSAWNNATQLLTRLGLLGKENELTPLGKKIVQLPLHPRLGVVIYYAKEHNQLYTGCLLGAILSERDFFRPDPPRADLEERVRILFRYQQNGTLPSTVDRSRCKRLIQLADSWHTLFDGKRKEAPDHSLLGTLLCYGFSDRIAQRGNQHNRYTLANGRRCQPHQADPLSGNEYLVAPTVEGGVNHGHIGLAAAVQLTEIEEHHPQLLTQRDDISWDEQQKRVQPLRTAQLGKITLHSHPLEQADPDRVLQIFLKGVQKEGSTCLPWNKEARSLQARIEFLRQHHVAQWPNLSDETIMADLEWLAPYCTGMRKLEQLKSLDLHSILLNQLSWEKQQQLNILAPTHITVPSGSKVRIDYSLTDPPTLPVQLQQLFGLTETPTICDNTVPLLLHLLSPARRPVQVTTDLHSFWQNSYQEVRKELAGRYPKHYWPENPLSAQPTATVKKFMK